MATLKAKERGNLPNSAFAVPGKRKLPIFDKARADAAAARLHETEGLTPEEVAEAERRIARAQKRFGEKQTARWVSSGGRVTVNQPVRGSVEIRHMTLSRDFPLPGVPFAADYVSLLRDVKATDTQANLAVGDEAVRLRRVVVELEARAKAAVWNQLAIQGHFEGHDAGPFDLTEQHFREIVDNFESQQNRFIPVDFHHASEAPPGQVARNGAPAQGWIRALRIQSGELWGLVEWGDLAREYIRDEKYRYFSPAIRFGTKDRVTGRPMGARLSSGALTNDPFLDGMMPLAASRGDGAAAAVTQSIPAPEVVTMSLAQPSHVYMPKLRAALGLSPAASAAECSQELDRICDAYEAAGGADHHGIPVSKYCMQLSEAAEAAPHMEMAEVFEAIHKMIDAAMAEHVATQHNLDDDVGGGDNADMTRTTAASAAGDTTMADTKELEAKLAAAEAARVAAERSRDEAVLTLDATNAKAKESATRVAELEADAKKRDDAAAEARITLAMKDYNLPEARKPLLLSTFKSNPQFIEETYPPKDPAVRTLDQNLSGASFGSPNGGIAGGGPRPAPVVDGGEVTLSIDDITRALMRQHGFDFATAQNRAFAMARQQGWRPSPPGVAPVG